MQRTDRPPQQRPRREETPGQGTIAAPGHPPMRAQPACPTDTGGAARDVLLAQLLEANERLVLAALRAQVAADDADAARVSERVRIEAASVGTLAAGVAHEINNPLAYVAANLDMVLEEVRALEGIASPTRLYDIEQMLCQAQEGAERMRAFVRGLKRLARPDDDARGALDVGELVDRPVATGTAGERDVGSGPAEVPGSRVARPAVVLVIDDEPTVGRMVGRALRGHDVTIVTSVRDALAHLDAGRDFDVILSDLSMPVASGADLHHELSRRFPALVDRLVFLTGGAFTVAAAAFLERVPNLRVEKPFRVADLRALVERLALSPPRKP